jgi:4'-phosphopantetheinyl transferase EntD
VSINPQFAPNQAAPSAALSELFPAGAVAVEMRAPGDPTQLFTEEAVHVARAAAKRIHEFAAGRMCARRALAEFGMAGAPLRAAADRRPLWPAGYVGSITHTTGLCVAVVAESRRIACVGVDSEIIGAAGEELWESICVSAERSWLDSLPAGERGAASTLLFAAKEAFYKCQYPLTGEWLDFHDIRIEPLGWGGPRAAFEVHATRRIGMAERAAWPMTGEYLIHEEFVTAGVALPASGIAPTFSPKC